MALPQWQYLYGQPEVGAIIRHRASDFVVNENLGYAFDGQGEHLMLEIEKTNLNTTAVVREIARWANVSNKVIGYAGLKDRNAITRQYFSVQLPGQQAPDLALLESSQLRVLSSTRNSKKLRRGALKGNSFCLVLRGLCLDAKLIERLEKIASDGVPNYFGQQRFGFDGNNIDAARQMFDGRKIKNRDKRSIYLSAARSLIFNDVVSERIKRALHQQLLNGDTLMLAGSKASFTPPAIDTVIERRFSEGDVALSAPMWGRGKLSSYGQAADFENLVAQQHCDLCEGLAKAGLKQERRALMLYPTNMQWRELDCTSDEEFESAVELEFELPAGCYATSILRELCQVADGLEPMNPNSRGRAPI